MDGVGLDGVGLRAGGWLGMAHLRSAVMMLPSGSLKTTCTLSMGSHRRRYTLPAVSSHLQQ